MGTYAGSVLPPACSENRRMKDSDQENVRCCEAVRVHEERLKQYNRLWGASIVPLPFRTHMSGYPGSRPCNLKSWLPAKWLAV